MSHRYSQNEYSENDETREIYKQIMDNAISQLSEFETSKFNVWDTRPGRMRGNFYIFGAQIDTIYEDGTIKIHAKEWEEIGTINLANPDSMKELTDIIIKAMFISLHNEYSLWKFFNKYSQQYETNLQKPNSEPSQKPPL